MLILTKNNLIVGRFYQSIRYGLFGKCQNCRIECGMTFLLIELRIWTKRGCNYATCLTKDTLATEVELEEIDQFIEIK